MFMTFAAVIFIIIGYYLQFVWDFEESGINAGGVYYLAAYGMAFILGFYGLKLWLGKAFSKDKSTDTKSSKPTIAVASSEPTTQVYDSTPEKPQQPK